MEQNMFVCTGNMLTANPQDKIHFHTCSKKQAPQHFIHDQNSYILSLIAELNNLAVSLYNKTEYAVAGEMLKVASQTCTGISLLYPNDNHKFFEDHDVDDLMRKIAEGKDALEKYDSSRLTPLSPMDLYFMPSSKCDRSAFLSEPARILLHSSENKEKNNEKCSAAILFNMGLVNVKIGATRDGQNLLQDAKKILSENHFIEPELFSSVLNSLGCIHYKQGKTDSALHLFHMAHKVAQIELQKRKKTKENECRCLLRCVGTASSNIGRVNFIHRKYSNAISQCLDALEVRKLALGEAHIEVFSTIYNLALIEHQLGNLKEAIHMYQVLMDHACNLQGKCVIPTQDSVTLLINILSIHCRKLTFRETSFKVSRALKRLQLLRDNLGYDDHNIPAALNHIANILTDHSMYSFVVIFLLEQLRIEKEILGSDHPSLANILNSIGLAYQHQRCYEQAMVYFSDALNKSRDEKGMQALTIFHMGTNYYEIGAHEKAVHLYEDAVKIQKEILGPYHPEIASMLCNIGVIQLKIGQVNEAMNSFMETLLIRRLVSGNDHSDVAEILYKIGQLFELKGEYNEALNVFYETLRVEKKNEGTISIKAAITLQNIAHIHHLLGNLFEAVKAFEEILSILKAIVGMKHRIIASILNVLGGLYTESGIECRSVECYRESQTIIKQIKLSGEIGASEDEIDSKIVAIFGDFSELCPPAACAA